jgi:hypothetical protein
MTLRLDRTGLLVFVALSAIAAACSGKKAPPPGIVDDDGAGGDTGSTSSTGVHSSSSGVGGAAPVDCSGAFGSPKVVLKEQPNVNLGSASIANGDLTLFYRKDVASKGHIFVSKRASKADVFQPGIEVPELTALCSEDITFDVSSDGLRAYMACGMSPCANGACDILFADRASLADPFVGHGKIGTAGPTPSISADDLVLVSGGLDPTMPPRMATRASKDVPFGAAGPIPGLESTPFWGPTLSPDGLSLYGSVDNGGDIAVTTRPSPTHPFGVPVPMHLSADPATNKVGAPDISASCRALYYVSANDSAVLVLER